MAKTMTHNVVKGVKNIVSGNLMTWWKTNFNMPVPWLYDFPGTPSDALQYYGKATSFDLTGFAPGWEIVALFCIWRWDGPISGTGKLYSQWLDRFGDIMFPCAYAFPVSVDEIAGYYYEYCYGCNQGVAGWEIDDDGNFSVQSWCTQSSGDDVSMPTKTTTITFSNVPSTAGVTGKSGYIWVEGNNLCYIDATEWKQTMIGTDIGLVDINKAGYMWIDTSNYLHWIGNNGHDYRAEWRIQQYASTWSNGPTDERNPGVSYKGYMWTDDEFGQTHLAYIGANGYKFLTGSGHYPYQIPY